MKGYKNIGLPKQKAFSNTPKSKFSSRFWEKPPMPGQGKNNPLDMTRKKIVLTVSEEGDYL